MCVCVCNDKISKEHKVKLRRYPYLIYTRTHTHTHAHTQMCSSTCHIKEYDMKACTVIDSYMVGRMVLGKQW